MRSSVVLLEPLESRLFLSVAPVVAQLTGSYTGQFKTISDAHFPYLAGNPKLRPFTLKIATETAQGGLTGTASIGGLGNVNFTGFTTGGTFRLVFSGDSSGLITGTVSGKSVTLRGSLYDFVGTQQLNGTFSATPSATAVTGNQALTFDALASSHGITIKPTTFAGSTNETLTIRPIPTALQGVVAQSSTLGVTVTSENSSGLITGTLNLQGPGSLPFTGITAGGSTTLIFSSGNVSGQIVSHASTTPSVAARSSPISTAPSSAARSALRLPPAKTVYR